MVRRRSLVLAGSLLCACGGGATADDEVGTTESSADTGEWTGGDGGPVCPEEAVDEAPGPGCGEALCGNGEVDYSNDPYSGCQEECDANDSSCSALGYSNGAPAPCLDNCHFDRSDCDECVPGPGLLACDQLAEPIGILRQTRVATRGQELGVAWSESDGGDVDGIHFMRLDENLKPISQAECTGEGATFGLASVESGWLLAVVRLDTLAGDMVSDILHISAEGNADGVVTTISPGRSPRFVRTDNGPLLITNAYQGDWTAHRLHASGSVLWSAEMDFSPGDGNWENGPYDGVADGDGFVLPTDDPLGLVRLTSDGEVDWHVALADRGYGTVGKSPDGFEVYFFDEDAQENRIHRVSPQGAFVETVPLGLDAEHRVARAVTTADETTLVIEHRAVGSFLQEVGLWRSGSIDSPTNFIASPEGGSLYSAEVGPLGVVLTWHPRTSPTRGWLVRADAP